MQDASTLMAASLEEDTMPAATTYSMSYFREGAEEEEGDDYSEDFETPADADTASTVAPTAPAAATRPTSDREATSRVTQSISEEVASVVDEVEAEEFDNTPGKSC